MSRALVILSWRMLTCTFQEIHTPTFNVVIEYINRHPMSTVRTSRRRCNEAKPWRSRGARLLLELSRRHPQISDESFFLFTS